MKITKHNVIRFCLCMIIVIITQIIIYLLHILIHSQFSFGYFDYQYQRLFSCIITFFFTALASTLLKLNPLYWFAGIPVIIIAIYLYFSEGVYIFLGIHKGSSGIFNLDIYGDMFLASSQLFIVEGLTSTIVYVIMRLIANRIQKLNQKT